MKSRAWKIKNFIEPPSLQSSLNFSSKFRGKILVSRFYLFLGTIESLEFPQRRRSVASRSWMATSEEENKQFSLLNLDYRKLKDESGSSFKKKQKIIFSEIHTVLCLDVFVSPMHIFYLAGNKIVYMMSQLNQVGEKIAIIVSQTKFVNSCVIWPLAKKFLLSFVAPFPSVNGNKKTHKW